MWPCLPHMKHLFFPLLVLGQRTVGSLMAQLAAIETCQICVQIFVTPRLRFLFSVRDLLGLNYSSKPMYFSNELIFFSGYRLFTALFPVLFMDWSSCAKLNVVFVIRGVIYSSTSTSSPCSFSILDGILNSLLNCMGAFIKFNS